MLHVPVRHITQEYRAKLHALASHDTLSLVARDGQGHVAAGVSTSGFAFKWPGRIGDSPICGAHISHACAHIAQAVASMRTT